MAVESMLQSQLERTECLHFTDNEEIIIEEGVDHRVSGAIESHHDVSRCGAHEADVGQRAMVVRERHSACHTVLNDTEIGEAWVRLQNAFDGFEDHASDPMLLAERGADEG